MEKSLKWLDYSPLMHMYIYMLIVWEKGAQQVYHNYCMYTIAPIHWHILVHAHMCVQQSCNDIFHSLLPNKRVVAFRWPMSILVSLVLNVTFNIHLLQKFLTTNTHPFCNLKNA